MSRASKWGPMNREELRSRWEANESASVIAAHFQTSRGAIYMQVKKQGLAPRNMPRGRKAGPVKPRRAGDSSGQRRFTGIVSTGPRINLPAHHPAIRKATTFFPSQVKPASMMIRLLKSGVHSRKLGGTVTKGRWRGFPIYSLTLEERDTCPRSCAEWATCYGNNMPFAARILDDDTLARRLWGELASLNAEHPSGFVVRLHVLGDFYSVEYVDFWRQALADFPALNVFGFTARYAPDPIGVALMTLVGTHLDRFAIRFSGKMALGAMASEVIDTAGQASGVLCPAESDPDRCCANCALCFNSIHNISFIRH